MNDTIPLLTDLVPPTVTEPCRCGHGRAEHGHDPRDTSCTECACIEWREARAG